MKREITNLGDWWTISTKIKKIKKKISIQNTKKRGRPKGKEIQKPKKSNPKKEEEKQEYHKYKLENQIYYDFLEVLSFLKDIYGIDYEDNSVLNDEEKQEFKAKLNDFFKNYIKIYNKTRIMILDEYIPIFLNLLAQFIELNVEEVSSNLEQISVIKQEEPIIIDYYFHPNIFSTESIIKPENIKRKNFAKC